MGKIGDAKVEISIDDKALEQGIDNALGTVQEAVGKVREALKLTGQESDFSKTSEDIKEVGDSSKESAKDVDELGERGRESIDKLLQMETVKNAIEGVKTAFREVKDFVMDTVESFADAELTVEKLKGGLTTLGEVDSLDRLLDQATRLQSITPFSDDDIVNMQGLLTTFQLGANEIEAMTPAMLNLSSAFARAGDTGMNLQQIAILFGKAVGADFTDALTRVGIIMTDTQKKMLEMSSGMEKVNVFLDVMKQNSSITAEAFGQTLAGKLKIAENAIDDVKEALGASFAPVILEIIEAVKNFASIFTGLPTVMQAVVGAIILVSIAVTELIAVMVVFDATTGGLLLLIGVVVVALGGLVVAVGANMDAIKDFVVELVGGQEAFDSLKEFANDLLEKFEEMWVFIKDQLITVFEDVKQGVMDLFNQFAELFGGSDDLLGMLKELAEQGFNNLKTIVYNVIQIVKDFIQEVINVISSNARLNTSLKGSEGSWNAFKKAGEIAINMLLRMIDIAKRTVVSILNLGSALQALINIKLTDIIFNPDKFEADLNQLTSAVTNVKEELTKEFNPFRFDGSGSQEDFDKPIERNPLTGRIDDQSVSEIVSTTKIVEQEPEDTGETQEGGKSGKGSDKQEDPFKAESESLEEMLKLYDRKLKTIEDDITLGEGTIQQREELIGLYLEELEALQGSLSKTENIEKVEDKIRGLKLDQKKISDDIGKEQEKNNKLLSDIDSFIEKRQAKTLGSAERETLAINDAYAKMEEKITQSKLDASIQREQISRLEAEKEMELERVKMNNELMLEQELDAMRLQSENDTVGLEVTAINEKYDAEKKRIIENYEEGKERAELLMLLQQKRNKELAKAQLDVLNIATEALENSFSNAVNLIGDAVGSVFDNLFGEAQNLVTDFIKFFLVELAKLAMTKVFKLIFNALSGGIFSGIGGIFSSIFKAEGGAVKKGQGYVVGEEGMEVFVPGMDGWIIPNSVTEGLMNRAGNINSLIDQYSANTIAEVPAFSISNYETGGAVSARASTSVGDINIPIQIQSLSGLDQEKWTELVDNELLPQISDGLRRIGKEKLDNSIKN